MTKKLSFSDKLPQFVLSELEKSPARRFSRQELEFCDISGFRKLADAGLLEKAPYSDPTGRMVLNSEANPCRVRKIGAEWNLVPINGDLAEMEPVSDAALELWLFDMAALIQMLREQNKIKRPVAQLGDRLWYLGVDAGEEIEICLGLFSLDSHMEHHANLKGHLPNGKTLVLSPFYELQNLALRSHLELQSIFCRTFAETITLINFKCPAPAVAAANDVPAQTALERKDYKKYEYKTAVHIHIKGLRGNDANSQIDVNGEAINLPEYLFLILLQLVVALKRDKDGRATMSIDEGKYQPMSDLRKELKQGIRGTDAKNIIQNMRAKQYRLSTHPNYVTYDKKALLKYPNARVVQYAQQLP